MADEQNRRAIIENLKYQRDLHKELIESITDENEKAEVQNELNSINLRLRREINEEVANTNRLNDQQYLQQQRINQRFRRFKRAIADAGSALATIGITTNSIYGTLMEIDGSIRRTTRSFGLAGGRADILRQNFEDTAGYALRLGSSAEELQEASLAYANEIGRARVHSQETLKHIIDMGKGTSLGVTQASRLVAQYETIGIDARLTAQYTEGILESSERMGVSAANVLETINKNFRRLQTFTFVRGVKSMGEMAAYAEKMRIDISSALDSAEAARRLDGAIDMAAQLQVMGGEFAKTDPFELLFLSRNDPAQFNEKISDLTKGVVTLRKNADGTFEQFLSPADRDRLEGAGKALNRSKEEMVEMARRSSEMVHIREQMRGMGLSEEEKEAVEGIAKFDSHLGKFVVQVGSVKKDISDLTTTQLRGFAEQSKSLEERAKTAQTFDEAFRATTEELKTAFLPVLKGINDVLEWARPIAVSINESLSNLPDSVQGFLAGAGKFFIGVKMFTLAAKMVGAGGAVRWVSQKINPFARRDSGLGDVTETPRRDRGGRRTARTSRTARTRRTPRAGAGMSMLRGGAGIGAAGLGMGAGIGAASLGISQLAESMSKLDVDQLRSLERIMIGIGLATVGLPFILIGAGKAAAISSKGFYALGGAMLMIGAGVGIATYGISRLAESMSELSTGALISLPITMFGLAASLWALTPAISAVGAVSTASSIGLLALGSSIAMIGSGIYLMSKGIEFATKGISQMMTITNETDESLLNLAKGVGGLAISLAGFSTIALPGMLALRSTLNHIARRSEDLNNVGLAFREINAVLSGSADDFERVREMVDAISGLEIKDKSIFSEIANLLDKPLKVEFTDKEVAVVSNITLNIDGEKIIEKVGARKMAQITENARTQGIFS